jgi:hypothetical protein
LNYCAILFVERYARGGIGAVVPNLVMYFFWHESQHSTSVDENQIAFNLDDNDPTLIVPPPVPIKPAVVKLSNNKPATAAKIAVPQLPLPNLTFTFTFDTWTWMFWAALLMTVIIRFYRIDTLQGEMYGDIEIVQTYTKSVLRGDLPWYFSLSSGPYIIT